MPKRAYGLSRMNMATGKGSIIPFMFLNTSSFDRTDLLMPIVKEANEPSKRQVDFVSQKKSTMIQCLVVNT